MSDIHVRCPKCEEEPLPRDVWQCSCGHIWNTFMTAGRCPNCGKIWKDTQCPSCEAWSPHIDWYDELDDKIKDAY